MIILYVILSILIILFAASVVPIKIYVSFQDNLDLKINWLFFKIYPMKEKKKKKPKKNKEISVKSDNNTNEVKKEKNSEIVKKFLEAFKLIYFYLKNYFEKLLKHLIIKDLDLKVEISEEDAAKTAISYGKACAVLYPILSFICNRVVVKKKTIFISPNFFKETSKVEFRLAATIKPLFILINAGSFLIKYIKIKTNKAVRKNERTSN